MPINKFLDSLFYPLVFLDFETFFTPIPLFDGTRPYQQVPFQYSLHIKKKKKSPLKHMEFLALPGADPIHDLIVRLLQDIPEGACVVTYTDFETKRLRDMAAWHPEYQDRIDGIIKNIRDLSLPFKRMDYYHRDLRGSYFIKAVLPHLVPEMTYDNLEIQDGGMAMEAYFRMTESNNPAETEKIRQALLEYCKLDTLAMVRITERLREVSL